MLIVEYSCLYTDPIKFKSNGLTFSSGGRLSSIVYIWLQHLYMFSDITASVLGDIPIFSNCQRQRGGALTNKEGYCDRWNIIHNEYSFHSDLTWKRISPSWILGERDRVDFIPIIQGQARNWKTTVNANRILLMILDCFIPEEILNWGKLKINSNSKMTCDVFF